MPFGIARIPEISDMVGLGSARHTWSIYSSGRYSSDWNGTINSDARKDHDATLITLLNRCKEKDLLLNIAKCRIATDKVTYMGHVFTSSGLKPDPHKVGGIKKIPRPTDKASVRRIIGMVTYLSKLLENLSALSETITSTDKARCSVDIDCRT